MLTQSESTNGSQSTNQQPISVERMIEEASERYGLSASQMKRIAWCESHMGADPNAYDGRSGYYGVYQFSLSTWAWASVAAGFAGVPATDDYANVATAHWVMATVGPTQWGCK